MELWEISNQLAKQQSDFLSRMLILKLPDVNSEDETRQQRRRVKDLSRPTTVIKYIEVALKQVQETLLIGCEHFTEEIIEGLADATEFITFFILPKRADKEKIKSPKGWKTTERVTRIERTLTILQALLQEVLLDDLFAHEPAKKVVSDAESMDIIIKACVETLEVEMVAKSRLHMCTIGSASRLPVYPKKTKVAPSGRQISENKKNPVDTVVIFDEGGCIPSYELFGLSQLDCRSVSLIVVGDVHQLPPYSPGSGNWGRNTIPTQSPQKVKSILDISAVSCSDSKVFLTTQYRVPRDIADLLNRHIYKGKYITPVPASVPDVGFNFVHIPLIQGIKRNEKQTYKERQLKYVNQGEIDAALDIISTSQTDGHTSILVLTPVR